jgi:hypothetical protein
MNANESGTDQIAYSDEWARTVYEQAQEIAHHSDVVTYEVAAIVWGAETLLLGFVLEVPPHKYQQSLVIVASALAILFALYVPFVMRSAKIGQHKAQDILQEIEAKIHPDLRLHTRIAKIYPKGRGQFAVYTLTVIFVVAWAYVLHKAINCVFPTACCG